jgi:hypothetical protein
MSTAPTMTVATMAAATMAESPLSRLLERNVAAAPQGEPSVASDPYARWHGFMQRAVLNHGVVASVSQFLSQRVAPVWNLEVRLPPRRPGGRFRR